LLTVVGHSEPSRYFERALVELRGRGVDAELVTTSRRGLLHDRLDELSVPNSTLAASGRSVRDLRRADVIHAHEPKAAILALGAARPLSGALRLFHRHHGVSAGRLRAAARLATQLADGVLAVSDFGARCAIDREGASPLQVRAVLNGVDVGSAVSEATLVDLRRQLGINVGDVVAVTVGRIREEKGQRSLMTALAQLDAEIGKRLHVVIVGEGPDEDRVRTLAARVPVVRVHFVGHQADPWPWYALSDLCVVPSRRESFGLAAAEAMGAGRPVVATAVGGLRELITDGVEGSLVPPDDSTALALAIAELVADSELRAALGQRARVRQASSLTVAAMVDRWLAAYSDLAEQRG
jgi:glycosyltransferase involved in cell wall biosynthesis